MATTMEASQSLIQSESRVSYQEVHVTERTKKKSKTRRHKDEGSISVSKSSEKLFKKMKAAEGDNPTCAKCARPVYAMERVKAERRSWHRDCFRCVQCDRQLTVESYESDHTALYCKPHFKQLFEPKPVEHDELDAAPKKHQMIICESQPVELPPDVVRASDKPELGLEELAALDVKSRFQVFEKKNTEEVKKEDLGRAPKGKSAAVLAKMAKFKAKGMDIGVSEEALNGVTLEPSSSDQEDDDDDDSVLKKSYSHKAMVEAPSVELSELVGRFERPRPSRHQQRKQEIQNIRSRLFLGKQAKIKEMYEQSVLQCEQSVTSADKIAKELEVDAEKARAIKQRFENGEIYNDENRPPRNRDLDDRALFDDGIAKKSRSIFLELDANAKHASPGTPGTPTAEPPRRKEIPFVPKDVIRAADKLEDVKIETSDIHDRFQFFETYKPQVTRKEFRVTPPREPQRPKSPSPEIYHEPSVVRSDEPPADAGLAASRHTASKMIDVFRKMEQDRNRPDDCQGPKPLKRFTPPPPGESERHGNTSTSSEYSEDEDSDDEGLRRYQQAREQDEALRQAQQLARTKSFRDRFENWSESERDAEPRSPSADPRHLLDDGQSQLETAKSLREKFEMMKMQTTVTKSVTPKVNRFV
ncbi:LIM domain and actin-binding protein 1 [Danaus plexippus]|nr:LIM domain and actin-binding protein 1 [Danaus plexippus]XP_061380255.1 LIM domain and actin-binding protein 1 [Danaus plexippus]